MHIYIYSILYIYILSIYIYIYINIYNVNMYIYILYVYMRIICIYAHLLFFVFGQVEDSKMAHAHPAQWFQYEGFGFQSSKMGPMFLTFLASAERFWYQFSMEIRSCFHTGYVVFSYSLEF